MSTPTVSVVIPTHNRPHLIGKAIHSVLDQTFRDFEIIVVDDGLERRAQSVVEGSGDSRVRYIAHDRERGCSAAKNTGIKNAKGAYVAFLDDDDVWLPEKLEKQVRALESVPDDAGFSFTGAVEIFDEGEKVKRVPDGVGDYHELALRNFNAMIASTLMLKKEVFDTVGLLDETFPTHTDIELLLRVTQKYRGVGIDEPLVRRLITSTHEQMGSNIRNRIRGREMLLAKYRSEFEKRPAFFAKHLTLLALFYRQVGEYAHARRTMRDALRRQWRVYRFLNYVSLLFCDMPFRWYSKLRQR